MYHTTSFKFLLTVLSGRVQCTDCMQLMHVIIMHVCNCNGRNWPRVAPAAMTLSCGLMNHHFLLHFTEAGPMALMLAS
jgi:hypothetical protein